MTPKAGAGLGFSLFMAVLIAGLAVYAAGPGRRLLLLALGLGLLAASALLWRRR